MMKEEFPLKICFSTHFYVSEPLIESHIREIASLGYRDIELWCMKPHFDISDKGNVKKVFGEIAAGGLRINSYHVPIFTYHFNADANMPVREWLYLTDTREEKRIEAVRMLKETMRTMTATGAGIAVLHADLREGENRESELDGLRKSLTELIPEAEANKTTLALENTQRTVLVKDIVNLVNEFSSPFLRLCIDFGHANLYEKPVESIKIAGDYLINTHVSDNFGDKDIHMHPGTGNISWKEIADTLNETGYRGALTLEVKRSNGLDGIAYEDIRKMFSLSE